MGLSLIGFRIIQFLIQVLSHFVSFLCTGIFAAAFDLQIEWLIVKGISHFGDSAQLNEESWQVFASVMAASLVAHILSDPCVFCSWPHFEGTVITCMT